MNELTFFAFFCLAEAADQENIETSAVTVESEYVGHETVPETVVPEKMSPPLPQPVPVIESVLSYEAKSFEPRKQREQVLHRESVERSNVDMDIKQGELSDFDALWFFL